MTYIIYIPDIEALVKHQKLQEMEEEDENLS